jgi:hypothetical protein
MLDKTSKDKIYGAVQKRPHTIQELAVLLERSWLTIDKYVEKLCEEGFIEVHTFRGGTRGALKIVYWNYLPISQTSIQKRFTDQILSGRSKYDFAPSDLAHFAKNKYAWYLPESKIFHKQNFEDLKRRLLLAKEEVLFFSGNLSFCDIHDGKESILDIMRKLLQRGVSIKILSRIELIDIEQIKAVLSLERYESETGKLSIRHAYHPLRAIVIDSVELSIKEVKEPSEHRPKELQEKTNIIYVIRDSEWVTWMQSVFFTVFRTSIDAKERIEEMQKITMKYPF